MGDIVDEFVVTLGLDPSSYKKEMVDFRDDLRKTKEETRRTARDMESDGRRAAESFNRLKNEIVGLFLVVAGGRSLGGLVGDMIHGAAETGRFGQAVGMATERVSIWEMAVQSMGGTAQDARAALAALNAEYTSYMLTGRAVHDADLQALGIRANDLQSPEGLALALAERRSHMTQREFTARLQRLGLPDSFIRTLAQGTRGVNDLLGQMERLGPVTERDARAAIEFERQWAVLTFRLRNELRPVLTWLVEQALPWIIQNGPQVASVLGVGIAGAVGLMTVALIRAAGPLGIIIAGLTAIAAFAQSDQFRQVSNIIAGWFGYRLGGGADIPPEARRWRETTDSTGTRRTEYDDHGRQLREIFTDNQGHVTITNAPDPAADDAMAGFPTPSRNVRPAVSSVPAVRPRASAPAARAGGATGSGGSAASGNYESIRQWFVRAGLPNHQAQALAGHIMEESGGLPGIVNTAGGGNGARGIYQWRGQRQRNFQRIIGKPIGQASMEEQLRFMMWELHGGDPGGPAVLRARTTEEALMAAVTRYGRNGPNEVAGALRASRSYIYGGGRPNMRGGARTAVRTRGGESGGTNVSVGSITVYTPRGTTTEQADAVAREIPRAVQRKGVVTQANTGLQ